MWIKWLLFLVALTAHFWLWGQWSLESSMRSTGLLTFASLLLVVMLLMPLRTLIRGGHPKRTVIDTYWYQSLFYLYVLVIVFLSVFSFTGLIKVLLPIKIALVVVYAFLKFKLKKKFAGSKKDIQ